MVEKNKYLSFCWICESVSRMLGKSQSHNLYSYFDPWNVYRQFFGSLHEFKSSYWLFLTTTQWHLILPCKVSTELMPLFVWFSFISKIHTKLDSCAFFQEAGTCKAGKEVFHHSFHKTAMQIQHTSSHGSFLSNVKKAIWNTCYGLFTKKKRDQRGQTPCAF